jgi:putative ABC transport system substrate-binding protein
MSGVRDRRAYAPSRRIVLYAAALAVFLPMTALAQQAGRKYRLVVLSFILGSPQLAGLFEVMAKAGFVEGDNLIVDRYAAAVLEDPVALTAEFTKAKPDAIIAGGDALGRAASRATKTIPIIVNSDDLLRAGLIGSLAHPEGNVTGTSIFATELNGKRQDMLIELIPGIKRLATLADPGTAGPDRLAELVKGAAAHGVEVLIYRATNAGEIAPAIEQARASGAQALNVLASAMFHANHRELIERVAAARLPAMFQWPEYVEEGALVGYGPRLGDIYRRLVAHQLIKVLRGVKPSDIPAEQPTDFEFGINLQTASKLGLTVPQTVLTLADQVIR